MIGGVFLREKLIEAAISEYASHGYHGATMRKIAAKAGIKSASIYFFYKNKSELFIEAFQHLLDDHFNEMKHVLNQAKDRHVRDVFSALLYGTIHYHQQHLEATNAYVSLVTAPIDDIQLHLQKHIQRVNEWMIDSLKKVLKRSYSFISDKEIDRMIKRFVLIGNGLFWGRYLYNSEDFQDQLDLAEELLQATFDLLEKYE